MRASLRQGDPPMLAFRPARLAPVTNTAQDTAARSRSIAVTCARNVTSPSTAIGSRKSSFNDVVLYAKGIGSPITMPSARHAVAVAVHSAWQMIAVATTPPCRRPGSPT
jgi:hypothetical protein